MASNATAPVVGSASRKMIFGQPRGLPTLFFTEMWERFSFYGMRALLPLYLIAGGPSAAAGSQGHGLAMTTANAVAITSLYMAMVYLPCIGGGWLGDRLWGPRRTVIVAGMLVILGHLLLAVPGYPSFFIGLALVAIGSGLLKPNISTLVGHLYEGPDDPRRDGGFTIFYMGINLGGLLAPLVIGTVGQQVSWHLGFTLAAAGMALGLVQFIVCTRHLNRAGDVVPKRLAPGELAPVVRKFLMYLAIAAAGYTALVLSGHYTMRWALVPLALVGVGLPVGVLVRIKRDRGLKASEHTQLNRFIRFFIAAAVFWMIYDQGASTMALFAAQHTSGSILGFAFPSSWMQSVNPLCIMALGPAFAGIWLWLARRRKEPSTASKFAMGLWLVGVSFIVFLVPMTMAESGTSVSPMWLVSIYLIQTIGELCLSPVGLSVTTKMAPAKYASRMMGIWFLAATAGDCVAALLTQAGADLSTIPVVGVEGLLAALSGLVFLVWHKKAASGRVSPQWSRQWS
ncbi:peptide MFS transporter [Streptomyces vinaceus]|uniref:peptide MFS transporter n=1 Tax=Streptomyces vinaceus TaxID=1960 RepID=UPI0035D77E52